MKAFRAREQGAAAFAAILCCCDRADHAAIWVTLGNYIGLYSIVAWAWCCSPASQARRLSGKPRSWARCLRLRILTTRYGTSPWLTLPIGLSSPSPSRFSWALSRCGCAVINFRWQRSPGE